MEDISNFYRVKHSITTLSMLSYITCHSIIRLRTDLYRPHADLNVFNAVFLSGSVCPLVFPNMTHVVKECANVITSQTACCKAMDSYVSQLQEQSFITNLQALNCAASLGAKLQKANVSNNVYELCHINLKDFSLQGLFCYIWLNGRRNVMLLYSCNFVRKIDADQCFRF